MTLKIVADAAIPFAEQHFSSIGETSLVNGRDINPVIVNDADILVVRTITRVDEKLLQESKINFVASATSGTDHVDLAYLNSRKIGFAYAPGCNARSVAEYVLSSLFVLSDQGRFDLSGKQVGIVGCGHVGSLVLKFLETLDIDCLVYDPPLRQKGGTGSFCNLEELISADIITLHVPLTDEGDHPTYEMFGETLLGRLKDDVILINTSRGGVVDEKALLNFLQRHPDASAVIDVWMGEPDINPGLVEKAAIGTPHIAGYSTDSKLRGTRMVYEKICKYFDVEPEAGLPSLPESTMNTIMLSETEKRLDAIQMAVLTSYDVRSDSISLRRMLDIATEKRRSYFDELRNNYPLRREFSAITIELLDDMGDVKQKLNALGFKVKSR